MRAPIPLHSCSSRHLARVSHLPLAALRAHKEHIAHQALLEQRAPDISAGRNCRLMRAEARRRGERKSLGEEQIEPSGAAGLGDLAHLWPFLRLTMAPSKDEVSKMTVPVRASSRPWTRFARRSPS
jgi:hypothetical protein